MTGGPGEWDTWSTPSAASVHQTSKAESERPAVALSHAPKSVGLALFGLADFVECRDGSRATGPMNPAQPAG